MNSDFGVYTYIYIPIYIYLSKYIYVYILQELRKWQGAELGEVEVGNEEKGDWALNRLPREGGHSSKPV